MLQTGAFNLGALQNERLKLGHAFEVLKSGVADLRVCKSKSSKVGQSFEVCKLGVGYPTFLQTQVLKLRPSAESLPCLIADDSKCVYRFNFGEEVLAKQSPNPCRATRRLVGV